ncbi:hypothetical protein GPJ56_005339 [Histomonas meleagridis]|uniref:uncharacterized protein n=1 Tax=Histomonas meleagridis TaxID=135588 RepID=UPI003559623A|nr:hypothetical protein GPJ56_005339 [Histomonas meleagridis]KAH0796319.1 hypothetical protein GO595_010212 [Histomonas meleagridis]
MESDLYTKYSRCYDIMYNPLNIGTPKVDLKFPIPQDFDTFEDYKNAILEWQEKAITFSCKVTLPLPVWGSVPKPFPPYVDAKYPNRVPHGFLGPENQLSLEKQVLQGGEYKSGNFFPVEGRFKKKVPVKEHFTKPHQSLYYTIPPEPDPQNYDSYSSYFTAVTNWTKICKNIRSIPEHPDHFPQVIDLEINDNQGHSVPDIFRFTGETAPVSVQYNRKHRNSKRRKTHRRHSARPHRPSDPSHQNVYQQLFITIKLPTTFFYKETKNLGRNRGISFSVYPDDFIASLKLYGCFATRQRFHITCVSRHISDSVRAIESSGKQLFDFKDKNFNSKLILHEIETNALVRKHYACNALYLWSLINYIFSNDIRLWKQLLKDNKSMYKVVTLIQMFSNIKSNIYDPMFTRYEAITTNNKDQIIDLFYHTLVRQHLTNILQSYCQERPKVYSNLLQQLQMDDITHKEALKNLLGQLHEIIIPWMQQVAEKDPTFLGTLFLLLLNSKSPYLEGFFNRFNTENQTIFHMFKKISETDLNMFHTLSILLIYDVDNAMIIYKMFNNVLICHALIDCMQIPMVNFMTSILKLQVSKNYIPIEQLSFLIYQIPKISPEKSTIPQLLLFYSFCDLLYREMNEKVISGEPLNDAFTGTLLMIENMLNISKNNDTIQLSLNCLNLFCEKFDCSFFFTNENNFSKLMNLMLSDSER